MTEKNSLVEEAIIQMKNLEEVIAENAKGILASTMKQEIKELVKESLNEADEDDEDEIEEIEDETEFESEIDDVELDSEMEDDDTEEFGDEEETIDLTNEPMSMVMKVFKKMGPNDKIEVQKDEAGNIHLTDNETDNEYMIMAESEMDEYFGEMDEEEEEEEEESVEDILKSLEVSEDETIDYSEDETIYEIEFNEEEDEDFMMEMHDEEMYDEEMMEMYDEEMMEEDDEDIMMESKHTTKPKGVGMGKGPKFDYGKVMDYPTKKMKKGDEAPYTGKASYKFDKSSPSLKGEFKEEKHTSDKMNSQAKMEKKEGMMKTPKKIEAKEASRTLGNGKYWGREGLPKPKAAPRHIRKESVDTQEIEILREKNEEYRKALNVFRTKLNEVAVFNSNLAYATRLFTEHSTSKQEKINILQRFDGVESLKESKNLYKAIKDELSNTKGQQMNESIERTIQKSPSSGSAINLIESKTYENPQFLRMKDLMSKLK